MDDLEVRTRGKIFKLKKKFRRVDNNLLKYFAVGVVAGATAGGVIASRYSSDIGTIILSSMTGIILGIMGAASVNQDRRDEIESDIYCLYQSMGENPDTKSLEGELYGTAPLSVDI